MGNVISTYKYKINAIIYIIIICIGMLYSIIKKIENKV